MLPTLRWDSEELAQSMSIVRFVARQTGLAGASDVEFARADLVSENVNDILINVSENSSNKDIFCRQTIKVNRCRKIFLYSWLLLRY